jgi:hypothetical protein
MRGTPIMRSNHKRGPVVCSNCESELPDYKEIANDIRLQAGLLAAVDAGDIVISISKTGSTSGRNHEVKLALSAKALITVASAPSRRRVLNAVRYPCPNPQCRDRFYEWMRL